MATEAALGKWGLAEIVVVAVVAAWFLSVVAAVLDPDRGQLAVTLTPVVGTIAAAAVGMLFVAKRRNGNGNGKDGDG